MAVTKISAYLAIDCPQKRYDYDANNNLIYEGWAVPGALSSAALWQIKKYIYVANGNTFNLSQEQLPNGSTNATNIWDNRAGLTYA